MNWKQYSVRCFKCLSVVWVLSPANLKILQFRQSECKVAWERAEAFKFNSSGEYIQLQFWQSTDNGVVDVLMCTNDKKSRYWGATGSSWWLPVSFEITLSVETDKSCSTLILTYVAVYERVTYEQIYYDCLTRRQTIGPPVQCCLTAVWASAKIFPSLAIKGWTWDLLKAFDLLLLYGLPFRIGRDYKTPCRYALMILWSKAIDLWWPDISSKKKNVFVSFLGVSGWPLSKTPKEGKGTMGLFLFVY